MEVLDPAGSAPVNQTPLAHRPARLVGCRVGVLDNAKPNADVLLDLLAELLVARQGAASIRRWRKPGSAQPAADIGEVAAAADVVLTGSAD